jgi:riboflavin biosynthesis pyrimidine reductase
MMRRLYPTSAVVSGTEALEAEYLHPAGRHVRANFVTSIDGMVEVGGRSSPLSGPADRDAFMAMRAVADVILVGAGTVREERYGPVLLEPAVEDRRRSRDQAPTPPLAIVSNRADLNPAARVFAGESKPLLLTTDEGVAAHPDLAGVAEVVVCGDQWVEIAVAVDALVDRGLTGVLCEGGPTLLRSLIGADLLDELCWTVAPRLVGTGHRGLLGDQVLPDPITLRLDRVYESDGALLTCYARGREP